MDKVRRWIKPAVQAMRAYDVPAAGGMIKLDAMENPYAWPAEFRRPWLAELERIDVNRYPDPHGVALKERLREVAGIPPGMPVMLGNGSDELIQIILMAIAGPGRCCLAPEPTFIMYRLSASVLDLGFQGVPLAGEGFNLDRNAMVRAIEEHQPAIIFIANPNNPTGNLFAGEIIDEIIRVAPGAVVLDEAYHAFSGETYLPRLVEFDNLLVLRTFSKSGLAGLRLGYLVGPGDWLGEFEKVRLPYNINTLTQKTAEFILSRQSLLDEQARWICRDRDTLYARLSRLDGIRAWPSRANFILFKPLAKSADGIYAGLKQQGILIKNMHGSHHALENCLRVTVGREDENTAFLEALARLL